MVLASGCRAGVIGWFWRLAWERFVAWVVSFRLTGVVRVLCTGEF